jgi:hypothetical protein
MRIGNKGRQRRKQRRRPGERLGNKGRQRRRGWLHITDGKLLVFWQCSPAVVFAARQSVG